MKHLILISMLAAGAAAGGAAVAAQPAPDANRVTLGTCIKSALERYPGQVTERKLEMENEEPFYELEIAGSDGRTMEVECHALTGALRDIEQEMPALTPQAFLSHANVSELQARHIALAAVPGRIANTEYEAADDGRIIYEFEIVMQRGGRAEVEVDARTGAVLEVSRDVFRFGVS